MKHLQLNTKTTLIGCFLIGTGVASVFVKNTSWTESIAVITTGVGLLCAKDHDK